MNIRLHRAKFTFYIYKKKSKQMHILDNNTEFIHLCLEQKNLLFVFKTVFKTVQYIYARNYQIAYIHGIDDLRR